LLTEKQKGKREKVPEGVLELLAASTLAEEPRQLPIIPWHKLNSHTKLVIA